MTKNRTKCCRDLTDVAGARGRQGVFEITFGIAESLEVYRREDPCCCSHCTSRHNATPRMKPTAPKCLGSGAPVAGRLPSSSKFRSYVDPDCLTTDCGGTESPMSTPYVSPPTSELPCRKISLSAATISSHPAHSALPLHLSPARASRQRWRGRASTAVSVFLFSFFFIIYILWTQILKSTIGSQPTHAAATVSPNANIEIPMFVDAGPWPRSLPIQLRVPVHGTDRK